MPLSGCVTLRESLPTQGLSFLIFKVIPAPHFAQDVCDHEMSCWLKLEAAEYGWIGVIILPFGLSGSVISCQPELTQSESQGALELGLRDYPQWCRMSRSWDSSEERRPEMGGLGFCPPVQKHRGLEKIADGDES